VSAGEQIGRVDPWNAEWGDPHLHLGIRLTPLHRTNWGRVPRDQVDNPDGSTDRLGWEDPWDFIHSAGRKLEGGSR